MRRMLDLRIIIWREEKRRREGKKNRIHAYHNTKKFEYDSMCIEWIVWKHLCLSNRILCMLKKTQNQAMDLMSHEMAIAMANWQQQQ